MVPNYQLLTKIQRMMTKSQPASTQLTLRSLFWCNSGRISNDTDVSIIVTRRQRGRHASFIGVQHCHNPWSCPVCTANMLNVKAAEVTQIVKTLKFKGLYAKMVTYTLPHSINQSAKEVLDRLTKVKRRFNRNLRYVMRKEFPSWEGTITSLEVKYNSHYGWHWHYHVLYFMNAADGVKFEGYQSILEAYWRLAALQELDLDIRPNMTGAMAPGGKISAGEDRPVYVSKGTIADGSYLAKEVVKYDNKKRYSRSVFELAASEDPRDNEKFFQFALAVKGRQRVQIGPYMRQYINEEELKKNLSGNAYISTLLVCTWSLNDWSKILDLEFGANVGNEPSLRKKLLTAAELDGYGGVLEQCILHGLPFPRRGAPKAIKRDIVTEEELQMEKPLVIPDQVYTPEEWAARQENIKANRAAFGDIFGLGEEGEQVTITVTGAILYAREAEERALLRGGRYEY